MKVVRSSAPGKAVLSGEYVVIDGAPAISVALNRRVTVAISPTSKNLHEIIAPGLNDKTWYFEDDGEGRLLWHDEEAKGMFALVGCVWQKSLPEPDTGLSIRIDSSLFRDGHNGPKLGLGSSAAVASALFAALNEFSVVPKNDVAEINALAKSAHSEYQGGLGSGVDIATSVYGGVIRFTMDATPPVAMVGWPKGLLSRFFWSGTTATTADHLKRFAAGGHAGSRSALTDQAIEVATQWFEGSATQILKSLVDYTHALQQFSDEYDLGIFDAGHRDLSALASNCGIVYKPCGAGGGDIGVGLATHESSMRNFCEQAETQNFRHLDVVADRRGVLVEVESKE